jgi:hypothetical protein
MINLIINHNNIPTTPPYTEIQNTVTIFKVIRKFTVATMACLTVMGYMYQKWPRVTSSFMTYNRVCNNSNTTGAISGAGTLVTLPEHLSSSLFINGVRVAQSKVCCVIFSMSWFVLLSFLFWPLYCLYFYDLWVNNYLFDVFKLFFNVHNFEFQTWKEFRMDLPTHDGNDLKPEWWIWF